MRKSVRARKPVDYFASRTEIRKEKIIEEENENEDVDDNDEDDHEEREGEDLEAEESSSDEKEQKSFNSKSTKREKTVTTQKPAPKGRQSTNNCLFDGFQNRKGVSTYIDKWMSSYRTNRVAAMAELLNFLLMIAGAGPKRWIQSTIDIDGFTAEEFEELLSEPINYIRGQKSSFFIFGTTQKQQNARESYVHLWESLTTKLLTLPDRVKVLSCLTETFLSLSTSTIPSIRDAITEASLSFGNILLKATVDLKVKHAESQRQLSVTSRGTGAKQKAILSMSKDTQKALRELDEMITAIFTTIFIGRSKDVSEIIRQRALLHLGEWMNTDSDKWIEDDYLKYIGWMASDRSHSVRHEALRILLKILEKPQNVPKLISFCERFIPRFIEMAVGDIEEDVSYTGVKLMRKLQMCGLLDQVDQSSLDLVDRIVFDSSSSSRVRSEALAFMMDHTEGFDDESGSNDDQLMSTNTNGGKKRKKSSTSSQQRLSQDNNEMKTLARRKKTALQLETLAEFVEHHLKISSGGNLDYVNLLAEACLSQRPVILRDWNTMFALLLRDSDSRLMLTELDPVQLSIIFRLCAQSAASLKQEYLSTLHETIDNESSIPVDWQNLQDALQTSLVPLLTRFRSEEKYLEIVLELLECFDLALIDGKSLQNLVKSCTELFETLQSESSLSKMGKVLRYWMSNQTKQQKVVISASKPLLEHSWTKILNTIQELATQTEETLSQPKKGKSSKRGKQQQVSDSLLHEMIPATRKFVTMWRCIDCRPLMVQAVEEISNSILEANQIMMQNLQNSSHDKTLIETIVENLGHTLFNILLWETRDIYMHTTSLKDQVDPEEFLSDELKIQIQRTIDLRTALVQVLESWMELTNEDGRESNSRQLECEAFKMIGDIRKLFPLRESNYYVVDELAWHPSEELFSKLGKVFAAEETRIRERLEVLGESEKDQAEAQALSRELVEKLFWPISGQMYDMENLHRRQAAVVLNYIVDPNQDVQRLIRAWIKSMKDTNFAKYLEAIVVALKHSYEDNVGGMLTKLMSSHQNDDMELEEDESELMETVNENFEFTLQIATKLCQTIGVGKLKSPLKELLVSFFQVGLKQAFSEIKSLGFLRVLEVFMKLLPDSSLMEVGKFYDTCLDNISEEMKTFLEGHINIGAHVEELLNDSLKRFTSHLSNIISGGKGKRNATTSASIISSKLTNEGGKKKKVQKDQISIPSSSTTTSVTERPKRKAKGEKSYTETNSNDSEDEDENEPERPLSKRGRLAPVPNRKSLRSRPRPSTISTISELTQESYDDDEFDLRRDQEEEEDGEEDEGDDDQEDGMEIESKKVDDKSDFSSPKKKGKNILSISSPIHQIEEEKEDVDDSHWGNPSRDVKKLKQLDPVLGLHLEDFGTDLEQEFHSHFHSSSTSSKKTAGDKKQSQESEEGSDEEKEEKDEEEEEDDYDALPSRRRR